MAAAREDNRNACALLHSHVVLWPLSLAQFRVKLEVQSTFVVYPEVCNHALCRPIYRSVLPAA